MQSPNHQLSSEPWFMEFYHTITELQGSKVSSTIRPPPPPLQGPTVSDFPNQGFYVKPQPPAFIRTLLCGILPHHHILRRLQSELDYPPPPTGAHYFRFSQPGALCKAPTTSFHQNLVL